VFATTIVTVWASDVACRKVSDGGLSEKTNDLLEEACVWAALVCTVLVGFAGRLFVGITLDGAMPPLLEHALAASAETNTVVAIIDFRTRG
jgi:hypothetical protein